MNIDKEFEQYFVTAMRSLMPDRQSRQRRLRVSGFPYCGLQDAYKRLTDYKETHVTSGMEFYTGTGTTAHSVYQRWLGNAKNIYGSWKCQNRKCNPKNSITVEFGNSNVCPKCKSEMEYEEFTVTYGRNLSGHLDGVYQDSKGRYWVIDYKTTSVRMIYRHDHDPEPVFPYTKNKVQVLTYCALIELVYKIKISGWILLYVARDDPAKCRAVSDTVDSNDKRRILRRIDQYDNHYTRVDGLKTFADIEYLMDNKPCKSREFYEQFYSAFKGCPLHSVCFTKELRSTMKLEFKEGIHTLKATTRAMIANTNFVKKLQPV